MSESDVHEWLVHVACAAEKADLASPAVIPMLQGWTKACAALRPPGIAPSSSGARQVAAPAAHLAFLSLHFTAQTSAERALAAVMASSWFCNVSSLQLFRTTHTVPAGCFWLALK